MGQRLGYLRYLYSIHCIYCIHMAVPTERCLPANHTLPLCVEQPRQDSHQDRPITYRKGCERDCCWLLENHYNDVIMGVMVSQITSLTIVYSTIYSGADQRKHQSSASLAFVWGIHRWPVNSPHKWPVTRKMFPFDDVIINYTIGCQIQPISSIHNAI